MAFRKILLIEDDAEDQEIFKTALMNVSDELTCEIYTDAREALEKLQSKELSPDVIFLDLNMPVLDGQKFLIELKNNENSHNIPVIIFSTTSNPSTVKLTKDMGVIHFITKPDRFDTLINILKPIIN